MGNETAVEPAGLYILEDQAITDPLREDPAARAAYSANPGFDEGAGKPHPIHRAENSLLARADIAEALEQVHLDTRPGNHATEHSETGTEIVAPVDTALALDGLVWLRKNISGSPDLRRDVIKSRDALVIRRDEEAVQREAAQERERRQARSEAAAREAAEQAERERRESEEAQRQHEAEVARQLDAAVEQAEAASPRIDTTVFRNLSGMLTSIDYPERREVKVRGRKGFQGAVYEYAHAFKEDPALLVKDMGSLLMISEMLATAEPEDRLPFADAYGEYIGKAFTDVLQGSSLGELTEENVDRWFTVLEEATDPGKIPDEATRREQAERESDPAIATFVKKIGKEATVTFQVLLNSGILANTLIDVAGKDPDKFIEQFYILGKRGLDPADQTSVSLTVATAIKVLRDPMANCTMASYPTPIANHKPRHQHMATDLLLGLGVSGLPEDEVTRPEMTDLSSAQRLVLLKTFKGAAKVELPEIFDAGKAFKRFSQDAYAEKRGEPTTIYGRIMEHRDEHSSLPMRALRRLSRR